MISASEGSQPESAVPAVAEETHDGSGGGSGAESLCAANGSTNQGTLTIDATCIPVNIRYPQDFSLLNEAREKLDRIISQASRDMNIKKPRTYCRKARKTYLDLAKAKKRPQDKVRKVIKFMLSCVKRNLGYLDGMISEGLELSARDEALVGTIRKVYDQQKSMYDSGTRRVDDRIVSIHMPFIRPIVRGKVKNPTEFGPKIDLSVDGAGNLFLEEFSFDAFNESCHLKDAVEAFHRRNGHYPERVLVDAIYRTSGNIEYCKKRGIRISGPKLGRPSKDPLRNAEEKKIEHTDMVDRIVIERHISRGKRRLGLDRVFEKLKETIGSTVALCVVLDNIVPVGF